MRCSFSRYSVSFWDLSYKAPLSGFRFGAGLLRRAVQGLDQGYAG